MPTLCAWLIHRITKRQLLLVWSRTSMSKGRATQQKFVVLPLGYVTPL
jgi:hypothetical protein